MRTEQRRKMAELAQGFVVDASEIMGVGIEKARAEFKDLLTFVPDTATKEVLKSYEENGAKKGEIPPLFCEVTLYELLGKCDARSVLAMIHSLGETLGFSRLQMERMMDDED